MRPLTPSALLCPNKLKSSFRRWAPFTARRTAFLLLLSATRSSAFAQGLSLGQRQLPVVHTKAVRAVAFSSDGKVLASGSTDRTITFFDVAKRSVMQTFQMDSSVTSVAFSPDGARFAAITNSGAVVQWDARTWARGPSTMLPYKWLTAVTYSRSGGGKVPSAVKVPSRTRTLLAVAGPERVKIFDADRLTLVGEIDLSSFSSPADAFTMFVNEIAFSPNGRILATGGVDHRVRLWDTGTWKQSLEMIAAHPAGIAFTPGGTGVVSGGDHWLRLWDARTGSSIRYFGDPAVSALALSPDGKTLAVGVTNNLVQVYDVETGALKRTLTGHTQFVESLAFSPDGSLLASASADKSVRLWRM